MSRRTTINGVPADQYGVWCPHGTRILVADPADASDYPGCIPVDPWPCDQGCTLAQYEADVQADVEAYEEERWAEYRELTR